jgi:hypothetical protein
MRDFIWIWQLGVGPTSVRYSEISHMETLPSGCTRIYLSLGIPIITDLAQYQVLALIDAQDRLNESLDKSADA